MTEETDKKAPSVKDWLLNEMWDNKGKLVVALGSLLSVTWGASRLVDDAIAKAETRVEQRVLSVVKEVRAVDMEHLDKRFDRVERLIERVGGRQ